MHWIRFAQDLAPEIQHLADLTNQQAGFKSYHRNPGSVMRRLYDRSAPAPDFRLIEALEQASFLRADYAPDVYWWGRLSTLAARHPEAFESVPGTNFSPIEAMVISGHFTLAGNGWLGSLRQLIEVMPNFPVSGSMYKTRVTTERTGGIDLGVELSDFIDEYADPVTATAEHAEIWCEAGLVHDRTFHRTRTFESFAAFDDRIAMFFGVFPEDAVFLDGEGWTSVLSKFEGLTAATAVAALVEHMRRSGAPVTKLDLRNFARGMVVDTTLANAIATDSRFTRITADDWGLAKWNVSAYESIEARISSLLAAKREMHLAEILAHFDGLGVTDDSVRTVCAGFPFQLVGGICSMRPNVRGTFEGKKIRFCHRTPDGFSIRVPVDAETMRGSSIRLSTQFLNLWDFGDGVTEGVIGKADGQSLIGRLGRQPTMTSLRFWLASRGGQVGDFLHIEFDNQGQVTGIELTRLRDSDSPIRAVAALIGAQVNFNDLADSLRAISFALWLDQDVSSPLALSRHAAGLRDPLLAEALVRIWKESVKQ